MNENIDNSKPTDFGAPRPADSSPHFNDWAANNPGPEQRGFVQLDITASVTPLLKAIATGARPVDY